MRTTLRRGLALAVTVALALLVLLRAESVFALDAALIQGLASEEASEKGEAIGRLATSGDPAALGVLSALQEGMLRVTPDGRFVIKEGRAFKDAVTGAPLDAEPEDAEKITINNRLRAQVESAIAALRIFSPDARQRLEAARGIEPGADTLPLLAKALGAETDPKVKAVLVNAEALARLRGGDLAQKLAALDTLSGSTDPKVRVQLQELAQAPEAGTTESEEQLKLRTAATEAVSAIERRIAMYDIAGRLFTGVSLGSILLLVALGLAITYGLLGVINMAHGEMLMIGAYATYATQQVFRTHFPGSLDWYLVCAVPVSFAIAAVIGMLLERTVIRWLYGRPLETLLATWGISLFLIQLVRQLFGAQNVEVANPSWMSGGIELTSLVLPYNRIVIIGFSAFVLLLVWLMLTRTRLGLFIRGVTQNRTMASCVGVPTGRVDLMAFGLGSGIGGLAGCALSQIGNVGPDLGQSYIIDSFMVVVLGGVGQLLGTVYAALGLGVVSKFLEPYIGAVPTKILVLVLIIAFIQKRPQGLFALKGRAVEA